MATAEGTTTSSPAVTTMQLYTTSGTSSSMPKCPVCELEFDDVDFAEHVDMCLRTYDGAVIDGSSDEHNGISDSVAAEGDDDVNIDEMEGYETYTWAGQTRVRATSLVEGGLRGAGFLTITRGDEDQVIL